MKDEFISPVYGLDIMEQSTEYISIDILREEQNHETGEINYSILGQCICDTQHEIFDICDEISKNNKCVERYFLEKYNTKFSSEDLHERSSTIFQIYKQSFDFNYVNYNTWIAFLMILNINIPKHETECFHEDENPPYIRYEFCFTNDESEKLKININTIDEIKRYITKFTPLQIKKNFKLIHKYLCFNSQDIIVSYLSYMFEHDKNFIIKKCENCGKWFSPRKSDTKYCNRISPQYKNKNCKEAMKTINKLKNEKSSEIKIIKKRIYNKYLTPYSTYGNENALKELEKFKKENAEWSKRYKLGLTNKEKYEEWLNSHYKRKKGVK